MKKGKQLNTSDADSDLWNGLIIYRKEHVERSEKKIMIAETNPSSASSDPHSELRGMLV